MRKNHLSIGRGMIIPMTNSHSQKTPIQSNEQAEDQVAAHSDGASTVQDSSRTKKALSKREIMEQLSRERFPWDE